MALIKRSSHSTLHSLTCQGLLSSAGEKTEGPLSCRAFARCLAFTPSHWSCFALYGQLNIHWARERKAGDWLYCPVVLVLTWEAREAGSRFCFKDDWIIYTKWSSSSKKDVHTHVPGSPSTLHKTSFFLSRGVIQVFFFQANAFCLRCGLITSLSWQDRSSWWGPLWSLILERGMAPFLSATHFSG